MAQKRVGRKRASPPCWTLPFFAAIFVYKVYFWTEDPEEEELWPADNSTDIFSVSRVGDNDTRVMEFIGLDVEFLNMIRAGHHEDKNKEVSIGAMAVGGLSIVFCFLILSAYGDLDKVNIMFHF